MDDKQPWGLVLTLPTLMKANGYGMRQIAKQILLGTTKRWAKVIIGQNTLRRISKVLTTNQLRILMYIWSHSY